MDIINKAVSSLNSSTFFAGIMMICLNIGSRYIQINLDESTESYIKYALTKEILVFTISWMATRNIYHALVLTAVFVVLADSIAAKSLCISMFNCFTVASLRTTSVVN